MLMRLYLFILFCSLSYTSFGQNCSNVEIFLQKKYPKNIANNENYVFYKDKANFELLDHPILKQYFPNYEFYAVDMTFKLRPDWRCRCVIFFDTVTSDFILHEPLSMNNIDTNLLSLIKDLTFNDSTSITSFVNDFHKLRQIGSKYKFIETNKSDTLISYDIVYFADQDYIVRPYQNTIEKKYETTQIMAKFYIRKRGNKIIDYIELSPKSKL